METYFKISQKFMNYMSSIFHFQTYRVAYKSGGGNEIYAYNKDSTEDDLYTYDGANFTNWKVCCYVYSLLRPVYKVT